MGKVCTTCGGGIAAPEKAGEEPEQCLGCAPEDSADKEDGADEAPADEADEASE